MLVSCLAILCDRVVADVPSIFTYFGIKWGSPNTYYYARHNLTSGDDLLTQTFQSWDGIDPEYPSVANTDVVQYFSSTNDISNFPVVCSYHIKNNSITQDLIGTGNNFGYGYEPMSQLRLVGTDNVMYGMGQDEDTNLAMMKYDFKEQTLQLYPLPTKMTSYLFECYMDTTSNIFYVLFIKGQNFNIWLINANDGTTISSHNITVAESLQTYDMSGVVFLTVYQNKPYIGLGSFDTVAEPKQYLFEVDLTANVAKVIFVQPNFYVQPSEMGFLLDPINGYMLAVLTNQPNVQDSAYFWMINLETYDAVQYPNPYPMPAVTYAAYYLE
ncbi:hypothetical protein SAMD00019534_037950 [Acytostelium subglobosum LB1]|uniref:hypothetical protein n=1 Tax=Acytostelium subglobosum LB1 TaxID=1410327 RepID=UPI000644A821|nr:hypothetical protein SAMD00019534_037950 [Acytostelium subglobosum LB1]GAM20620.1 hypothetical protein SAMD00019534_037950 [Acytostelium subglobosum LB1]|eukprot:XP_012760141.1 hypothetical protein SAMD00019534_037950 [Acytostelium subglobosum LB1]